MGRNSVRNVRVLAAVIGAVMAGSAWGSTTATWDGTTNNWSSAADWGPTVVPNNGIPAGTTYAVTVNGGTVTVDINPTVDSLMIGSGGTVGGNAGVSLTTGTLSNGGTLSFRNGQTLTVSGLTMNTGTMDFGGASTDTFGSILNTGTVDTNFFTPGGSTFTVSGAFTNSGNNSDFEVGGNDTASVGSLVLAGTVQVDSGGTLKITNSSTAITDVPAGSTLYVQGTLTNTSGSVQALSHLATVEGILRLENGQTTAMGAITVSSSGQFLMGNATTVTATSFSNSGTVDTNFFTAGGSTFTVSGAFTNIGSGSFEVGGNDTASVGSLVLAGTVQVDSGGTLKITNSSTAITDVPAGSTLYVQGTLTNTSGSVQALSHLATVEGELRLENGQTTAMGSVTVSSSGQFLLGNASTVTATSFSNSGAVNTNFFTAGGSTFTVSGAFNNIGNGSLEVGGNDIASVGSLAIVGTITVDGGGTLKITGSSGAISDVPAGSTLAVFGTLTNTTSTPVQALSHLATVEGELRLENGQTTAMGAVTVASGGQFLMGDATTVTATSFSNSGTVNTNFFTSGNSTFTVSGAFNNIGNGSFEVGGNDIASVGSLAIVGTVTVDGGGTLKITGSSGAISDVPGGSTLAVFGTLTNTTSTPVQALSHLTTLEGELRLENGQTTAMGGVTVSSTGQFLLGNVTTVTATSFSNSGTVNTNFFTNGGDTFTVNGAFTNIVTNSSLEVGTNDTTLVGTLSNAGLVQVDGGGTLTITGGGLGVTDAPTGAQYVIGGTFNLINGATTTSALANLSTVEGTVRIQNGQSTSLGAVTVSNTGTFATGSATTVTLSSLTNSGTVYTNFFTTGGSTFTVTGTFTNNAGGVFNVGGGDTVSIGVLSNAGTVNMNNASQTFAVLNGSGGLINLGSNTLTLNGGTSTNTIFSNGLTGTLITNGTVQTGAVQVATLDVNGQQTISSPSTGSKMSTLALTGSTGAWTSGLHLTFATRLAVEDAATHAATLAQVKNQVLFGKTHALGIYVSGLAGNQSEVVSDNAIAGFTNFGGVSVDAGSVLVMATYNGDANLDGVVNISDLNTVAANWQKSASDWTQGDFNGDGIVNISDLNTVAANWQAGSGSGESFGDAVATVPALGPVSVPEPGTLAVLGAGSALLLRRRRKID